MVSDALNDEMDLTRSADVMNQRIERMHGRDRLGALALVAALWVVILFVLARVWPETEDAAIRGILVVSGGFLLLFNTAAIVAMLKHYASDKRFIYGLDLKHLDEMRSRRPV
jgi:hypothetical protein